MFILQLILYNILDDDPLKSIQLKTPLLLGMHKNTFNSCSRIYGMFGLKNYKERRGKEERGKKQRKMNFNV